MFNPEKKQKLFYQPAVTPQVSRHSCCMAIPSVPFFLTSHRKQEAHWCATVSRGQSGRVAVFHVSAAAIVTRFTRCPQDLLELERSEVGAPVHVTSGTAVVGAI
jgi:hypothetical protein